jgi:hypothetical protein
LARTMVKDPRFTRRSFVCFAPPCVVLLLCSDW